MAMAKQKMKEIIEAQPDDASYEEIIRELAFERMIEKGLADARSGRVIPDDTMRHRIKSWQK
jgi:predicted transcriptional regulator